MDELPRIGLAWQMDRRYGGEAIRGIAEYANRYGPWLFFLDSIETFDASQHPDFDGVLVGYDNTRRMAEINWPKGIPIVSVHQVQAKVAPWQVWPDNVAVGRLVATEFINRGYRNLAYCPASDAAGPYQTSDHDRLAGFRDEARRVDPNIAVCPVRPTLSHGYEQQWEDSRLSEWIQSLPKPVGIMAVNDPCARHVLLSAAAAGVRVPEEAAVIGVGNETWSEVVLRGLSSVELDGFAAGYAAAEILHRLLEGEKIKPGVIKHIPPRRLVTRRSSSAVAIVDPDVVLAIHFIAEHATSGVGVREVVDAVPLSRRALERHFQRALGRSILQEIRSIQVERAKRLLADASIPMKRIAKASGLRSSDTLAKVFRRMTGMSPSAYRQSTTRLPLGEPDARQQDFSTTIF